MGKASVGVQEKISQLDTEIAEHDSAVSDLRAKALEVEEKKALLLGKRCDLLATTIFSDLEKALLGYVKNRDQFLLVTAKIVEYGEHRPSLYERAKSDEKHDFWLVVADGCLKPGDMRDFDVFSFMKKVLSLTKDLAKKEDFPFPGLHRNC